MVISYLGNLHQAEAELKRKDFKIKNLEDNLDNLRMSYDENKARLKLIEKLCRDLCESILAKDPEELRLGPAQTWSSIPLEKLIGQASRVFTKYSRSMTDLLRQMQGVLEERRLEVEKIAEELEVEKKKSLDLLATLDQKLEGAELEPQEGPLGKEEGPRAKKEEETQEDLSVIFTDEEGGEFVDGIQEFLEEVVEQPNQSFQAAKQEAVDSKKDKKERIQELKKKDHAVVNKTERRVAVEEAQGFAERKDISTTHIAKEISGFVNNMGPNHWFVLQAIYVRGMSRQVEIFDYYESDEAKELILPEDKVSLTTLRARINDLANNGLLETHNYRPAFSNTGILLLPTGRGQAIYKDARPGEKVLALEEIEAERLRAEHTSYNHGYGILDLANTLALRPYEDKAPRKKFYKEIQIFNRSKNGIPLGQGQLIVPDAIAVGVKGQKHYYEYELAHHTTDEMISKLTRYFQVGGSVYFVASGDDALRKLKRQFRQYYLNSTDKTRVKRKNLYYQTIRVLKREFENGVNNPFLLYDWTENDEEKKES